MIYQWQREEVNLSLPREPASATPSLIPSQGLTSLASYAALQPQISEKRMGNRWVYIIVLQLPIYENACIQESLDTNQVLLLNIY